MTPCERFLAALNREIPDRVPYFEYEIDKAVITALHGRELPRKKVCRAYGVCDMEWWKKPPIFAESHTSEIGRDFVGAGLICSREDWERITLPDPVTKDNFENAKKFCAEKDEFAAGLVFSCSADPVLLSLGYDGFGLAVYDTPDLVEEMLDAFTTWTIKMLEAYQELDFDFALAGDDLAFKTGPFFSPKTFRDLLLPYMKKVADAVELPWIQHSDGNLVPILDDLLSLGMNGLHPIEPEAMDIFWLKENYGDRLTICGNIDINTLCLGTVDDVRREVREKVPVLMKGGGYIAASSTSISESVKPENFVAMVEEIQAVGTYQLWQG